MSDRIKELITVAGDLRTSRVISLSSTVVLAYDIILTFPEEVDYVWSAQWSTGKFLYLSCRYPVVLLFILSEMCLFHSS
ncbi:hypothetical protein BD410DRAFT_397963 [Rickenella mellea]|uniref:DUF6533 domain-containing protein n=1 Tax=Rickenella mellea TaxID=50990 RepID=A0A4Y7PXQ2_9AGAM|nr:hypothetical protein BD410DRAFT_397963 [Rickenella mellea]